MNKVQKAEQAMNAARSKREKAELRVQEFESSIGEAEASASRIDAEIKQAHSEGKEPGSLSPLRRQRRELLSEADELRGETGVLEDLVAECAHDEERARVELERAKRAVLREEAGSLGRELRDSLSEVAERIDKLEALETANRRSKSVVRELPDDRPGDPGLIELAGYPSGIWVQLKAAIAHCEEHRRYTERRAS